MDVTINEQKCGIRKNVDRNTAYYALPDKEKMDQERRSLAKIGDGFKRIIITKDAIAPLYNENGILVMSVYDFLLKVTS